MNDTVLNVGFRIYGGNGIGKAVQVVCAGNKNTAIRQCKEKRAGRTRTGERGYSTFAGRTQGVLQYGNTYAGGGQ